MQEALTNVLRHAEAEEAVLSVRSEGEVLVLEVVDAGPGRHRDADRLSAGHGLVGMGERVALFGGHLTAGPYGPGWRVRAELPVSRAQVGVPR